MATGSAASLGYVTCRLRLAYTYDDAAQATLQKTIRIPLQSHHTLLTDVQQEFGTTGGADDAPTGQIPALSIFLPEDSKVIYQAFLDLSANEATVLNTTDFTPYVQIDAAAEVARAPLEQGLGTNNQWNDLIIFDTATFLPSATHTVKARSTTTSRLWGFGGFLVVTYGYAKTSTTVMAEAMVPFVSHDSDHTVSENGTAGPDVADADWLTAAFNCRESSPTMRQSAICMLADTNSNGFQPRVWFGARTERQWNNTASGQGQSWIYQRIDHGAAPATLVQGINSFIFKSYTSSTNRGSFRGHVLYNYTCASPAAGPHTVTLPRAALFQQTTAPAVGVGDVTKAPLPIVGEYALASVYADLAIRSTTALLFTFGGEAASGELGGGGFCGPAHNSTLGGANERITRMALVPLTQIFNRTSQITGRLNVENSRRWRWTVNVAAEMSVVFWACYSTFTYSISGTVSGYTGDGSGITVELFNPDDEKTTSTVTGVGGTYSFTTLDNRPGYWTAARQSGTLMGRSDDITPS